MEVIKMANAKYSYPDVYVNRQTVVTAPATESSSYIGGFIGKAERGVKNTPVLITSWQEYIEAFANGLTSPFTSSSYLAYAVYDFFQNGGSDCYVLSASDGKDTVSTNTISGMTVTTVDTGAWSDGKVFVEVATSTVGSTFDVKVYFGEQANSDSLVETFTSVTNDTVIAAINNNSEYIKVTSTGEVTLEVTAATALSGGKDSGNIADYKTILKKFDVIDDVTMLSIVDATKTDSKHLLEYCTENTRIHAILCTESETATSDTVVEEIAFLDKGRGNYYYPWVTITDPITYETKTVPNVGKVQGTIIRMALEYGYAKVPAGTNATLTGAIGLSTILDKTTAGKLNELNVSCLMDKKQYGICIWGGRSLFENGRYISSILLETLITRDLEDLLQQYIFEPNNPTTWSSVRRSISSYLKSLWEANSFEGSTEAEAFSVICDATTNTANSIAKKELNATVKYREKDCAEFIIINLSRSMQ